MELWFLWKFCIQKMISGGWIDFSYLEKWFEETSDSKYDRHDKTFGY